MIEKDIILDESHTPSYDEIQNYIEEPSRERWSNINAFLQEKYKALPKIAFSKCSGKPGWNIKYQKSGKSLCTLYPEKNSFVILIVVTLGLVSVIEAMANEFNEGILAVIGKAEPFNGTKWLMIQVNSDDMADSVKKLILLKNETKKSAMV